MLPMFCALLVLGSPAEPPPPPFARGEVTRVAVAPIVYSEVIPNHTRAAARATLGEAVQKTARNTLLLDVDAECRTRECALGQARDADAEFLLELAVTFEQRDYTIEIVVIVVEDGRSVAEVSDLCHLCAQAELLARIATQMETLQDTLGRSAPKPIEVRVPVDEPIVRPAAEPGLKIAGWVSFTLGLAGVGVGAAMIAIDGREHGPTCGADVRDIQGACPNVYTTRVAGLVGVGLGGAALATGVGLLIGSKRNREVSAWIAPAPGGLRVRF